tara:strand:+ start:240 stop:839 length:600 start_codon:yes stop_codon:yes gene_type:complete
MSKFLYIVDAGHGAINPESGRYVTAGKRSPFHEDGSILYEGVENRRKVKAIISLMKENNLDCLELVDTWQDVSLRERVEDVNKLTNENECIFISIHSNAYGRGWTSPKGISIYHFEDSKQSNKVAKIFHQELSCNFDGLTKDRGIKESRFYVLKNTRCPAVLLELGFHSNKEESKKIMSNEWIKLVAKSVVDSCLILEL